MNVDYCIKEWASNDCWSQHVQSGCDLHSMLEQRHSYKQDCEKELNKYVHVHVYTYVQVPFWFAVTPCVYLTDHKAEVQVLKITSLHNSYLDCRY